MIKLSDNLFEENINNISEMTSKKKSFLKIVILGDSGVGKTTLL